MMEILEIITDLSIGGVIGFVIGLVAKTIIKIAIALIGIYIASLTYLHYREIITINTESLQRATDSILSQLPILAQKLLSLSIFGGGFLAGFYIGFRRF